LATESVAARFMPAAIEAVRLAGAIHLSHLRSDVHITRKGAVDIVTDVDIEAETAFRAMIAARFPDHTILAEEMAETAPSAIGHQPSADGVQPSAVFRWLFDPLDGTVNYAHGLPFFCASLALEVSGAIELAAVYDPLRDDLFTASRTGGACLNGQPIAVSSATRITDAVLGTGFPHGAAVRDRTMERMLGECAIRARGLRRLGSAALDLCYVACGRMAGFWDQNLQAWDTAAGALIVSEAGGTVTALDGGVFDCYAGNVLATNGVLHQEILEILRGR
jgi:myo-inositol-1(or 4)-monophosphatase